MTRRPNPLPVLLRPKICRLDESKGVQKAAARVSATKSSVCFFAWISAVGCYPGNKKAGQKSATFLLANCQKIFVKLCGLLPKLMDMPGYVDSNPARLIKGSVQSLKKKKSTERDPLQKYFGILSNATGFHCFEKCSNGICREKIWVAL